MFSTSLVSNYFIEQQPRIIDALNHLNNGQTSLAKEAFEAQKHNLEILKTSLEKQENVLNELFVLRTYFEFLIKYSLIWEAIRENKFSDSWQMLQHAMTLLRLLKRHTSQQLRVIDFFESQLQKLESLYPYNIFFSIGAVVDYFECSICNIDINSEECPHMRGELYGGEMAIAVAKNIINLDHISVVKHPADKCCVVQYDDKGEQFKLIRFLSELMSDKRLKPFDFGELRFSISKIKNPDYEKLGRNQKCFCGSGKKFKQCCIDTEIVEGTHVDIIATPVEMNAIFLKA